MEGDAPPITVIGHPFAPIGMGEQLRSHVRACNAVHLPLGVFDIFRYAQRGDAAHRALVGGLECVAVPGGIRIFHVNGDEVERVVTTFEARGNDFGAGYNVIVPAWELAKYPKPWAAQLERFDEVWALSSFIRDSLGASGIDSHLVGQSVELPAGPFLPRRFFEISESAFVLLNFFDLSSYATRKNPEAAIALFQRIRREQPWLDVELVLKIKDGEQGAHDWAASLAADPRIRVISAPLDSDGVRSLVNACDCFVSLHRAEGFGRGLGEAMALGRLTLATGWSGNLDFMTPANSLLAGHAPLALRPGDYPHAAGQSWADPDLDHAYELIRPVLAEPTRGSAIALRGRSDVLRTHGNRAVGLRILARVEQIAAGPSRLVARPRVARPRAAPAVLRRRRVIATT